MSTRWRIFLAAVALSVVPLAGLSWALRGRLTTQYEREFTARAGAQLAAAIASLQSDGQRIRDTLDGITTAFVNDNPLRLAILGGRDDYLPHLRDAAGEAMLLAGLQVLQLQDADGVILSSGHYRNEFGRAEPELPALLRQATWSRDRASGVSLALVHDRLPEADVLAIEVAVPFTMADRQFALIGGEIVSPIRLANLENGQAALDIVAAAGPQLAAGWYEEHLPGFAAWSDPVALVGALEDAGYLVRTDAVPLITDGELTDATLVARVDTASLDRALRDLDVTVAVALAAALSGAFLLAAWLSARLSRPLRDLSARAARIDLDQPAADFATARQDEVGKLARVLDAMVARLRDDARRLADLEHRATLGEVARQVNHDLRNGITPVRNVLRHLGETAEREPDRLAAVFAGRRATLEQSLAYLEELAGRYARLAPEGRRLACDLGAVAREAAAGAPDVVVQAGADAPPVIADPVALRRIVDNLLRNAREALPPAGGAITVTVTRANDPDLGPQCLLAVRDDGAGMTAEVAARIFEDFFTTKPGGTGLGLSIVRRLAGDVGGRLHVDSAPGAGTTITIAFPAAEAHA
ncbi:MAG TPA: sensor histidine kinase [Candidatus Krumholzibacteria bacterium]|nr:sensor histidine kinase [Candidatus Krumholzibacteria bacterium]HPD70767.1 sensor histidine kinase [Candidatus Krumholzibacteria bacterium]HRY39533.1 sensor histidine kinase [Candidatus Krumholzibacteria bacterium]